MRRFRFRRVGLRTAATCFYGVLSLWAHAQPRDAFQEPPARSARAADSAAAVVAPPPSGPSAQQVARRTARPVDWRLNVEAPSPLDALLLDNLDLARYQSEASQAAEAASEGEVEASGASALRITRGELRRLLAAVPDQARGLLEAEGYFAAQVRIRVDDPVPENGGAVQASSEISQPVTVHITVDAGPRTVVQRVQFVYEGELDNRLSADDAAAKALTEGISEAWTLSEDEPFRQADWTSAKNAALARLRADTYPMATWSGTSVTVDAQAHQARLFLVADSGPAFAFGEVRIEGLERQPPSAILNLAPFRPGQPYRERQMLDWQERIQKVNLFESVYVSPAFDVNHPEATPLTVQVREAPMQEASIGVGASSDNGPRVSFEHLHRNPFDSGWQVRTKAQLGLRVSDGLIDLLSHPWQGRRRGLASLQVSSIEDNDNAITRTQRLKVGRLREGERLERTDYVEAIHASVRSSSELLVANATALSFTSQWIFRDVDSQVQPTRGTTTMVALTGGRTVSALERDGHFGRVHARFTAYLPLPGAWQLQVRAEGGKVLARDQVSVPDALLFRAGGDDSIRGYAYRSIGVERDGVTTGGRVLGTGSIEVARPLWPGVPNLLGAVFIDAGDAAENIGQWSLKRGHGAGIRWRSPVGPFRIDIARGASTDEWRLHFSVGVSL
jgi:translocation and assembly module TamA